MKTSDGIITLGGEAMATSFRIRIADVSEKQARQAAAAAWADLARLEGLLSRYIESSDVTRLNRAPPGEPVRINADTLQCLELALQLADRTMNAFNPLLGAWTGGRPPVPSSEERPAATRGTPRLTLNGSDFTATRTDDQVLLDLGGIGKGFALDAIGSLLREWDVPAACIDAGGSTALAFGRPERAPPWLARIGEKPVPLQNAAVAGSGTTVKGDHIVDGRTGRDLRHHHHCRVWSTAATATEADALSTAFFVLAPEDIREVCTRHPQYSAAWQAPDGTINAVGPWAANLGKSQV